MLEGNRLELPLPTMLFPSGPHLLLRAFGKMFQKCRVSSPAPVTMELPSGFMAKYSTRNVWPVSVASFSIVGYFQTITWFNEYPCVLTSSSFVLENTKLHTWEPVLKQLNGVRFIVFQNRMHWSAVPPPVANSPR